MRDMSLYHTKQWLQLRAWQLASQPWCRFCLLMGAYTKATTVDHVQPHHGQTGLFFDARNLQSLCKRCHDSIKQAREKGGAQSACNVLGRPRSRRHHWNRRVGS